MLNHLGQAGLVSIFALWLLFQFFPHLGILTNYRQGLKARREWRAFSTGRTTTNRKT